MKLPLALLYPVVGAGEARAHRQGRVVVRLPTLQPTELREVRIPLPGRPQWRLAPAYGGGTYGTVAPPRILQGPKAKSVWVNASQVHGGRPVLPGLTAAHVHRVER